MAVNVYRSRMERRELARIARMYHLEGVNQPEIARRMHVSVASVSRALARASNEGIVRVSVEDEDAPLQELELAIERLQPGLTCRVAPTGGRADVTLAALAQLGARLLERRLVRGELLGVSWGETLRGFGEALPDMSRLGVAAVPTLGSIGLIETGIYPNAIAQTFARRLGGDSYIANIPAVVDTLQARAALLADSGFSAVRDLWESVDAALLGVSSVESSASIARCGAFTAGELADLRDAGVACVTNFNFLTAAGGVAAVPLAERLIVMGVEQLRRMRLVALVAIGPEKSEPLRIALQAGIGNVLLTDETAAQGLIASWGAD